MYLLGGNDVHRTFDDVWRIALSDCVVYARTQMALRYGPTNTSGSTSYESTTNGSTTYGSISRPTSTSASSSLHSLHASYLPTKENVGDAALSRLRRHPHPHWECVYRHSSLCGGPSARIGHCVAVVGHQLVVYGGRNIHQVIALRYLCINQYIRPLRI